jgi:hypothetical protein
MPVWAVIFQALALPAIAIAGICFTRQQVIIARTKLRYDLFDKRYAVYVAAWDFLGHIFRHGGITLDALSEYTVGIVDSHFLLDDSVRDYLMEIRNRAAAHQALKETGAWEPVGPDKTELVTKARKEIQWLIGQTDVLAEKFKPFLTLEPKPTRAGW